MSSIAMQARQSGIPPPPADPGLPALQRLFDQEWVWRSFCTRFGEPDEAPDRVRPKSFVYRPGVSAFMGYVAEWPRDGWLGEEEFTVELVADRKSARLFRYPEDPFLPGLQWAASAVDAHSILPRFVGLHPERLTVETVRYRPTTRAILRHMASWGRARGAAATLFVRVVRPGRVQQLLAALDLARHSGFVLPRLAGCWAEEGVLWVERVPGRTVRQLIGDGSPPDPDLILDCLAQLWSAPVPPSSGRSPDLTSKFRWTSDLLSQVLEEASARGTLHKAVAALQPFVESWLPAGLAHNDFYDGQMILTPSGRLALIDFEETGPGDPMMDVGNLLAHLRWMARTGIAQEACSAYRQQFRSAALARFRWEERALDQREAFALFRLASNPVRRLQQDWPRAVELGLELVTEVLGEAP